MITFDAPSRTLGLDDRTLRLTAKESAVFSFLFERVNQVVPRSVLEQEVWGHTRGVRSEACRVLVSRLRRRLGDSVTIESVRGIGWRLRIPQLEVARPDEPTCVALILDRMSERDVEMIRSALAGRPMVMVVGKAEQIAGLLTPAPGLAS